MNPGTIRILFALFLIAHGWIHMGLAQVPLPEPGGIRTPYLPSWWRDATNPTWPAIKMGLPPQAVRTLGWALWVLIFGSFAAAGAALLLAPAQAGVWQSLTILGSAASLLLLGLYWHPWLPIGVLIDLALLAAIFLRSPLIQFGR